MKRGLLATAAALLVLTLPAPVLAAGPITPQLPVVAAKPITPTLTIAGTIQSTNTKVMYLGSLVVPKDGTQPWIAANGYGQMTISMGTGSSYSGGFSLTFVGMESFHASKNAPQAAVEYTATGENLLIVCANTGTLYRMSITTPTAFSASLQKSLKSRLWSFPAGTVTATGLTC